MTFASPLWLLALLAIPLALALHVLAGRRRQRYAVRFPAFDTLAGVAASMPQRRRHLPAALAALAALALVLAVAKPQVSRAVPIEQAQVVLVTDTSGSMNAQDVNPSRIEATKRAAGRFVSKVAAGQKIGLVAFSDAATVLQTPTEDHDAVRAAIAGLSAQGATATGDALASALDAMRPRNGEKRLPGAIVLLSDGQRTAGGDPIPIAREAKRLKIPVYTISLGTADGAITDPNQPFLPPTPVPPDPVTMRQIAQVSGGRSYSVEDSARLDSIYSRLGARLGTRTERHEITAAFAGGGLLLLGAAMASMLRRRSRLP